MKKKSKLNFIYINKKKTLTGLFLFFTCLVLNAQISGTAVNELKEPVAFATVILKTAQDSSITDTRFKFTVKINN
ncbi:hypothetical protein A9Q93_01835 [Nonlabens dokdonensis]|uniref:Uncharacterized protein n=1 Tax=Nonlabens dokdonensis TaxID=328515 RepID=A0A1Z8BC29_9FLAO|nr:hypothetical protein [Nonlabens dokdonensis]OUS20080.1 hypothetical protein A9Q93_01835 [Nonlabens dokdonensis]